MIRLIVYLSFILVVVILLFQANHPVWSGHLKSDVGVFYSKSEYFIHHLNFRQLKNNEYQPGALLFFTLLSPVLLIANSAELFTKTFIFFNLLLILFVAFLYQKITSYKNILVFSLILLSTGPIIFYRFELLVVAAILITFYFWLNNNYKLSAISFALAALIKVYPVIFLPYFLIKRYKSSGLIPMLRFIIVYLITIIVCSYLFLFIFQINFDDFKNSLNYHLYKSVSIESIWGTLVTLAHKLIFNTVPPSEISFSIWVIPRDVLPLPLNFFNYFWVIPITLLYLWLLRTKTSNKKLDVLFLIVLVLSFVISSKVQAPQYLLWFALLIPLINFEIIFSNAAYTVILFLILLILFMTQFIYPLSFDNFIQFYTEGKNFGIFWINAFRNLLILIVIYLLIKIL